jgi:hypothetical protein
MKKTCLHGETGRCGYCAQDENIRKHNEWRAKQGLAPINATGNFMKEKS